MWYAAGVSAVAVKSAVRLPAVARTTCAPVDGPSVHFASFATPSAPVTTGPLTVPLPEVTVKVTVTPALPLPTPSVIFTIGGRNASVPASPSCTSPDTFTMTLGGPAATDTVVLSADDKPGDIATSERRPVPDVESRPKEARPS